MPHGNRIAQGRKALLQQLPADMDTIDLGIERSKQNLSIDAPNMRRAQSEKLERTNKEWEWHELEAWPECFEK